METKGIFSRKLTTRRTTFPTILRHVRPKRLAQTFSGPVYAALILVFAFCWNNSNENHMFEYAAEQTAENQSTTV